MHVLAKLLQVGKVGDLQACCERLGRHAQRYIKPVLKAFEPLSALGMAPKTLALRLKVTSFSDLEQFCEDVHRRYVLELPSGDIKTIIAERIAQWKLRASIGDAPGR